METCNLHHHDNRTPNLCTLWLAGRPVSHTIASAIDRRNMKTRKIMGFLMGINHMSTPCSHIYTHDHHTKACTNMQTQNFHSDVESSLAIQGKAGRIFFSFSSVWVCVCVKGGLRATWLHARVYTTIHVHQCFSLYLLLVGGGGDGRVNVTYRRGAAQHRKQAREKFISFCSRLSEFSGASLHWSCAAVCVRVYRCGDELKENWVGAQ